VQVKLATPNLAGSRTCTGHEPRIAVRPSSSLTAVASSGASRGPHHVAAARRLRHERSSCSARARRPRPYRCAIAGHVEIEARHGGSCTATRVRDSSLVTFSEDLPPHQEPSLRSRHYQRRPLACSQGAKHSPGYDRLRIARRAQCRAAMTPDVFSERHTLFRSRVWRAHLFVDLP
jgi:hypothetical protein